jgi:RimJ/RimL family protein N-acetyltransferase
VTHPIEDVIHVPDLPAATAPILTTERLILRAHTGDDFADCLRLWTDPDVVRFFGGKASGRDEVWNRILRYAGLWSVLGYGYWAMTDRETGAFLGEGGLANFERPIEPALGQVPETGWALIGAAHGRGLATEAMRAVLGWADETLACERTCCIIEPSNRASVRVANKLGYEFDRTARLRGSEIEVFQRPRGGGA